MEFKVDVKGVKEALENIDAKKVVRATTRALNRSAASGRTEASKQIRQQYEIKKMDLDKHLTVEKANYSKLTAALTAVSSFLKARIPLIQFKVKQSGTKIVRQKGRSISLKKGAKAWAAPVQVQIKKGSGWKTITGAFVAKMKSGHIGVFQRRGTARTPIKELSTVDVPLMFSNKDVMNKTKSRIVEQFDKDFAHELDRELKK